MILLDLFTFLGRMHPLIVHLPIGFLYLAFLFDTVSYHRNYRYLRRAVPFTLLIGFGSACVACVLGYMLSLSADYDREILSNHKFSAISLTLMAGLLYAMTSAPIRKIHSIPRSLFSGLSAVTFLFITYAGHQGASLAHGKKYISLEVLRHEERKKPTDVAKAMIFEDIVHPILQNRCIQCHGSEKRKGQLSMESLASLLRGGEHGPAVVPGNPEESELIRRITLDPSHEDFMPAEGKTPLTKTETQLLRWWIEKAGAAEKKKISDLESHEEIRQLASAFLGLGDYPLAEMSSLPGQKINANIPDTLDMRWVENLRRNGLMVRLMFHKPVMLDVTLPPRSGKKMADMADHLRPVASNIIWLNLSDNNFTENDLGILRQMANVEKLRLEKNPISDGISDHLDGLKYLEAVNLNETKITPVGLNKLKKNPSIKRIYTWKTLCDTLN